MAEPEIRIARNAGFCCGVRSALKKLDEALVSASGPVFVLGEIIHNPRVVEEYRQRGASVIRSADEVPGGATVVTRAHGITLDELESLFTSRVNIVHGTCQNVKDVSSQIEIAIIDGIRIFLAGEEEHPETKAHMSHGEGGEMILVRNAGEIENIDIAKTSSLLLAQTTFDPREYKKIAARLGEELGDLLEVRDTICDYTLVARREARKTARGADAAIIIGGRNSANTRRLAEECRLVCEIVMHVETAEEISPRDMYGAKIIAVTAGASTPPDEIEKAIKILSSGNKQEK